MVRWNWKSENWEKKVPNLEESRSRINRIIAFRLYTRNTSEKKEEMISKGGLLVD